MEYFPFFSEPALAEYFGITRANMRCYIKGSSKSSLRVLSKEKCEMLTNFVMYVPPMNEPNEPCGYRVAFRILTRCVEVKNLCDFYGFDFYKYREFMQGNDKALRMKDLQLLYKAFRLRPLNKIEKNECKK